ncbi:MAG: transcription-repair coupling factor [Pseudomonadota bacterium]
MTASPNLLPDPLPLPPRSGDRLYWDSLHGCADAAAICELSHKEAALVLLVTKDSASATRFNGALEFFGAPAVLHFPDWETLPYDAFSPHQDIISERLRTLTGLSQHTKGVLTVPVATLLQKIAPVSFLAGSTFEFKVGHTLDTQVQRQVLIDAGYLSVDTVTERGQFAVRGSVMDIYPMGAEHPIRVDLFDDEIDTLRTFDPDSQRTIERIDELSILPAKEFPFDADAIRHFRDRWHHTFDVDVRRCSVYQDVSDAITPNGIEYYLPFFFPELDTLFSYLPQNVLVVVEHGVSDAAIHHLQEVNTRYESLRHDIERPILPPDRLFLQPEALNAHLNTYRQIHLSAQGDENTSHKHRAPMASQPLPDLLIHSGSREGSADLAAFANQNNTNILFVAESQGRREVFDEMLRKSGVHATVVDGYPEYLQQTGHCITVGDLHTGLIWDDLIIITEADVLGTRSSDEAVNRSTRIIDPDQIVRNLTELSIGAPVVHVEHGVGRYQGLQSLTIDGDSHEFLMLSYADDDKLYVPVTALHLISRYSGSDEEHAPLHRLGSDQWEKAKRKAAEKVVDVAAELLDVYARRELKTSHRFTINEEEYRNFSAEFPFEVTEDQQTAIADVLADMTTIRAMDRLVCGDVGFGKTEVAMRAAFVAVQGGKQVALLVPTTLLAQQHYDTLRDRFANWPISIESVSRLRSPAEIEDIQGRLRSGKVDIIVGTHKLLSDSITFKDLGLVIIDEEHRFGVRQKEKLKTLRAEVDVLTLTATPIPRTLNMAMSGIRDLSIIATPPAKRLSIKTFVQESQQSQIKEAISRELLRGGQVFYLHNEVRSIQATADKLTALIPEARIGIGHGQMPKRELETVMSDFYHRRLNVLVCTTIIETGIDIPNANTIIIERADKFGLAQLHQLRGRVGRSHRQAYAYLLTPHPKALTRDAQKRLEAIEAAGDLGVGFTLATHDMEIRGAGELLGDDQSGQIESVGFSMYMDLLERAINTIKAGHVPDPETPLEPVSQEVNLHAATLIPEDYLPDVHTRLILYKRIANAATETALDELQVEIIDRFGLLPPPLKRLFAVTELKIKSQSMGILKLDIGEQRGKVEFNPQTQIDPINIIQLVQNEPNTYRMDGATTLRTTANLLSFEERVNFAQALLARLTLQPQPAAASS